MASAEEKLQADKDLIVRNIRQHIEACHLELAFLSHVTDRQLIFALTIEVLLSEEGILISHSGRLKPSDLTK